MIVFASRFECNFFRGEVKVLFSPRQSSSVISFVALDECHFSRGKGKV